MTVTEKCYLYYVNPSILFSI